MKNWLFAILCFGLNPVHAQIDLKDFNQQFKQNPKPIFLYFNTDWCRICKIQEKEIEKNESIKSELNSNFYFIKLNGESLNEIEFLGQKYQPNIQTKTHSFVTEFIAYQDIAFPLWIILDENLEVIGKFSGLIKKKNFNQLFQQIKKE
ncbi:thioredoxin family protein [Faecalibacter bovis]|uniref:Thioredoxin fold domain-containing protein n=1 Tax=Faecalibacter bovis TaxID=2898187 RepID=A0ABX7XBV8_9FLAO|nr:thioredoxin fold domain-containing protein [Faecalibacter bovis]QTV05388.1 thioredoxin fold domain-containing protein [Faecalibacter bovis]